MRFVVVCQDVFGSLDRCKQIASKSLSKGHSVVVDRTNPGIQQRREWFRLARDNGANRIFVVAFDMGPEDCERRCNERLERGEEHKTVTDAGKAKEAIANALKNWEQPQLNEVEGGYEHMFSVRNDRDAEEAARRIVEWEGVRNDDGGTKDIMDEEGF